MADYKPPKGSPPDVDGRSDNFYKAVLKGIGAPVSDTNLQLLRAWQAAEGGTAAYNPFNTTRDSKAKGQTNYNTFGQGYHVRNYPSFDAGVATTVATLKNYPAVIAGLRIQSPESFMQALVNSSWSGGYNTKGKIGSRDYRQSSVWAAYQRLVRQAGAGSSTTGAGNATMMGFTTQGAGYEAVLNPFSLGDWGKVAKVVSSGQFWIRTIEMLAGFIIIIYGLVILTTGEANIDWQKIAGLVTTKGASGASQLMSEG